MNKFLAILLTAALVFSFFVTAVSATETHDRVETLIDDILTYKTGGTSQENMQSWLDNTLSQEIGSAEWYLWALSQSKENLNFSAYVETLGAYVTEKNIPNAVTKQKYALAFLASGVNNEFVEETSETAAGKLGIMSLIYGLHLLANDSSAEDSAADTLLEKLLSLHLADGGFALTGTVANPDVTAMAIQALAHYKDRTDVSSVIHKAVECLANLMQEDGNYISYGVKNAESAAQVIIALSAVNIDIFADTRFIKNDKTLLDTLTGFRLGNGSFSHEKGAEVNENATSQALCALIALRRAEKNNTAFYDFDRADGAVFLSMENTPSVSSPNYRMIVVIILLVAALIACAVLFFLSKRHPKNFLAVAIVVSLLILIVLFVKIESTDNYYGGATEKGEIIGAVTMSIRCDAVAGNADHIPNDGTILPVTSFAIDSDDTVYDILTEAARTYGISIDKSGAEGLYYVSGINYLYEFDFGDLSGWVYEVNGERASVGCDAHTLHDGDEIIWQYTLTVGKELS